jgi:hypothetical protein
MVPSRRLVMLDGRGLAVEYETVARRAKARTLI